MAKTILPIAGAVIGFWIGGPSGAQWGYAAGSLISAAIPSQAQGPRIGETGAQTSQEGAPRAIIYGTAMCTGNVIASGPLIKRDIEENQGGKGGTDVSVEHAYRSYAVRVSEPIGGYLRIWQDDKLVYDMRTESVMLDESAKWAANKVFYLGDESQLPDPTLQMIFGVDEVPAHRGSAYLVFIEEDLTDRRGSIPQYRFEVASQAAFVPSPPIRAPLKARMLWQAQTTSATFTAYDAVEEKAVWKSGRLQEGSGLLFTTLIECYNYDGGADDAWRCSYTYPGATDPTLSNFVASESPGKVVPAGFSLVTAPARQLADVVWDGDVLLQDGLGPVLLPDDPNYANDAYWANLRDLAIAAGTLRDFVSSPVDVPEYAERAIESAGYGIPVALAEIVADIHRRCDFPLGKVDVSVLDDMVTGLVLAGDYSGADAINTLRSLYLFDRADYDKRIHYPKRGAAVVATLTYDDLVEEPDTSRREQAIEYPKKLHLGYQNAVGGYAVAKATSSRSSPDVRVVGETTMQIPVVLTPDQAAQTAAILHKVAYAEAEGEVKISIPDSFLRFVPSNCIGLALRGRVSRLRIEQIDVAAGIIELTLRHDRQSAYTSNVTGVPIPAPTPPPPTIVGESVLAVIDISARVDSEDDLHVLVATTGAMPAWNGSVVQRSLDFGANYSNAASVPRGIVMGSLVNPLPMASELYTDTTNVLRVQLFRGGQTIEDITEVQFLSEGGSFVIMRPDGSSEVLQYRDAAEVSPGVFDLSYLHRGQLNSGGSEHASGALLVMLERAVHVSAQSAWIGAVLWHRAVSNGESPELAPEQAGAYVGRSQLEWPVAYLSLGRTGSVVNASWTPRHRFGSDDAPVASINFTGYRVTLTDGIAPPVSFDTLTAAFSYDASALASPVTVSIAALNRITGPGPAVSESI